MSRAAFEFIIILLYASCTNSAVISSSKLQLCARSEADFMPCEKKFVVALTIDGGQNNTEEVAYWKTSYGADGTPYQLTRAVKITIAKSTPMIRYPVSYIRSFNGKPTERTIFKGVLQCEAESSSPSPACGRAYDDAGAPIGGSEGFCCKCSLCDLVGFCKSDSRANTHCSLFGEASSASCLTFSGDWYSAYSIGPAESWYRIVVTVTDGLRTSTLHLGPDELGVQDPIFGVSARLIGDFAKFRDAMVLSERLLLIPSAPMDSSRVRAPVPLEWLFVAKSDVTLDGTQCNKIGVSYNGFNSQGSRCQMPAGYCVKNQIDDFRAYDLALAQKGLKGDYMVSNFGKFGAYSSATSNARSFAEMSYEKTNHHIWKNMTQFQTLDSPRRPYVAYELSGVQATLLTLTFVADNMTFTTNVASGVILHVNLSSFTAATKQGRLEVVVMNTGSLTADFHITVTRCSPGTFPIAAQIRSLNPLQFQALTFDVYSENTVGGNSTCNVTLRNALFAVVDVKVLHWSTTAAVDDKGSQGGSGNGNLGGNAHGAPGGPGGDSCTDCPFYNPLCFLTRACFLGMFAQVATLVGVLGIIIVLLKYRAAITSCLCKSKKGSKGGNAQQVSPPSTAAVPHTTTIVVSPQPASTDHRAKASSRTGTPNSAHRKSLHEPRTMVAHRCSTPTHRRIKEPYG